MGIFKKLFSGAPAPARSDTYTFTVRCGRCGEVIEGRVNLANDLSADYEGGEGYRARKVLMGSGHCFQQIEVELKFDPQRKLLEREIQGGQFAD